MTYWAGSDESWQIVLSAQRMVAEGIQAGRFNDASMADERFPPLWAKVGNTAIISMKGSLIDGQAGFMRYFGVVGYDDLAQAAVVAYSDPDVTSVLWDVASQGGHVHGLADFSSLVTQLSKTKPSLTYTGNTMASAAYWSGSSVQGPIIMAPTAEVGSLGVMQVTRNISKQLEMEGISMQIHRAGDMKARVNPIEEITPEAKAHLDQQLADLHGMFKGAVKRNRPTMTADNLVEATDGRTFLGQRAIKVGLADSIGSFDMALKLLDRSSRKKDTSPNSKGAAMFMTPVQIAQYQTALTAGSNIVASLQAAGVVATPEEVAELEKSASDFKAAQDKQVADAETKRMADEAAAAGKGANAGAGETVNDLLKSQLVTANASLLAANVELTNLKASTQSMTANHDGLLTIARQAVANMAVPMGGTSAAADAMDATAVIAEHARITPLFREKFKIGQQSKGADGDVVKPPIDPAFLARVKSQANRK